MTIPLTHPLSVGRSKAGRLGGEATKKKLGRDHYVRIGKMGRKARRIDPAGVNDLGPNIMDVRSA